MYPDNFFWVGGSSFRSADVLMSDIFVALAEEMRDDGWYDKLVFGGEAQEKFWKDRYEETDTS